MNNSPKIEVCANCSGFDVKELKDIAKAKIGCIGKCSRKCPELCGKVYGFLNGVFTVCDSKDAFFAKIASLSAYTKTSDKNPLVDAFLEHTEQWLGEFAALRELAIACGMTEELKWGQPCYTYDGGNVVILGGFKNYIALSFFKGALMKDPDKLLVRQTESVQAGRQLRFTSVSEIEQCKAIIEGYLLEAIDIEKKGLEVPVESKPELEIPQELQNKFDSDPMLKDAFYSLTPGRQRGYLYHFSSAKQSKTREARIEKLVPKILEGKGFDE